MNHAFLSENHTKRLEMPLWMLLCFAMFNVWQMGFIFFMGPSLVIDGRTPLPISMDNITLLIVASYILSIIYMFLVPHLVVWAVRISTSLALLSVIGLFLPLPAAVLEILIYIQVFCCCFMIGFETFIMTNMFSENSTMRHLTVAYSAAVILVAVVQNDLFPVSFPVFRILALIMLIMMMVFFMRLPCSKSSLPTYVKKGDGIQYPKKLFGGIIAITFVSALMMLGGPAAVTDIPHGISIAYTADAAGALILYFLYKKKNLYPMRAVSVFMSLSVAGFLLLYISSYLPSLKYIACILVGFGFLP